MAAAHRSSGKARWWTAANLLTLSRLLLAPFAVREIVRSRPRSALALLIAAGATDFLDGFLARRMSDQTEAGQLLDPLADKVLLSCVYGGLAQSGAVPLPFVALVFGRDLFLLASSIAVLSLTEYRGLEPSLTGKASTLFQIGTAAVIVLGEAVESRPVRTAGRWLLFPTGLLTAASGLQYAWRGWQYFASTNSRRSNPGYYPPR